MLGKLFNAEWKATSKWLLPLNLILIVVTIMGKIILSTGLLENEAFIALSFILTTFYVLSIFAISIITIVLLVMRFYKSLFTDEGYLTFTLPVKSHQLLISKVSVATIWCLINAVLTILSVAIIVLDTESLRILINEGLPALDKGLKEILGFSGLGAAIFILAYVVISAVYSIMMFDVSICIGQLMTKHKVLGSVLSYIGLYMLLQTISTIALFAFGLMATDMTAMDETEILGVYRALFPIGMVASVAIIGFYFTISNHIMKYKVNLD